MFQLFERQHESVKKSWGYNRLALKSGTSFDLPRLSTDNKSSA
jgi:hypothetical protein